MPVFSRVISIVLRFLELASAAIIAGIVGGRLRDADRANVYPGSRFIYAEVIAAFSMFVALIFLIPFTAGFTLFPLDLVFFVLWIVAFGTLVDYIAPMDCSWYWNGNPQYYLSDDAADQCSRWKAALGFMFLSAIFWLLSAIVGMWFVHRARSAHVSRTPWYKSHPV